VLLAQPAAAAPGGPDQVEVLGDTPGRLSFSTRSPAAAVLVVSEAYFPGWQATVDDEPAAVLPADGALLAVALPAGDHQVRLLYRPSALLAGAGLTLLSLIVAAGLWLLRGR